MPCLIQATPRAHLVKRGGMCDAEKRGWPSTAYLWTDHKGRELLLAIALAVVAGVDTDFDLSVETAIDIGSGVEAPDSRARVDVTVAVPA